MVTVQFLIPTVGGKVYSIPIYSQTSLNVLVEKIKKSIVLQ